MESGDWGDETEKQTVAAQIAYGRKMLLWVEHPVGTSSEIRQTYEDICRFCYEQTYKKNIAPDVLLALLRGVAEKGYEIPVYMFSQSVSKEWRPYWVKELNVLQKHLENGKHSDALFSYALLLGEAVNGFPQNNIETVFSLVESIQKNPNRPSRVMMTALSSPEKTKDKLRMLDRLLDICREIPASTDEVLDFVTRRGLAAKDFFADKEFVQDDWYANEFAKTVEKYAQVLVGCRNITPERVIEIETCRRVCRVIEKFGKNPESYEALMPAVWDIEYEKAKDEYAGLTERERKQIQRVLTTDHLQLSEKKYFMQKGIRGCLSYNMGYYLKIRDYMRQQVENSEDDLPWLIRSAAACVKIYGKDYMSYFRVIENYNKALPQWQENCWSREQKRQRQEREEKLRQQYVGYSFIADTLKNLPNNRIIAKAALKKNLLLFPLKDKPSLDIVRKWCREVLSRDDFCLPKERRRLELYSQSLLGTLFSTVNNIDYRDLAPIGMKRATAWMLKADRSGGDLPRIRRFFDKHLKASNAAGEVFLRLNAPHYQTQRIECLGDCERVEPSYCDDFLILADKLGYLSDRELETMKYGDIYERLSCLKYKHTDTAFAIANSAYVIDQEHYDSAEEIYLLGKITPSLFANKPVLYNEDKTLRCRVADKDDPRILFVGHHTSCCQSYSDAGSRCAVNSILDPNSGCLIWEKCEKGKDNWQICACSWFYESQNGKYKGLTFDNVEIAHYYHNKDGIGTLLNQMVKEFACDNYRYISQGRGNDDLGKFWYNPLFRKNPLPEGYKGYTDADRQRLLYANPAAVPEKIDPLVICAGCREDFEKIELPPPLLDRLFYKDEREQGRCTLLKDKDRIYAAAVWVPGFKTAAIVSVSDCSGLKPERVAEFCRYAEAYIRRDVEEPEIGGNMATVGKSIGPKFLPIKSDREY